MVSHGKLILRLNKFEVERYHGRIGDPDDTPDGTGVLLWFEIDDFYAAMERVSEMKAEIIMPPGRNPPSGDGGPNHWKCWLRGPGGYAVVLASTDGSAG